MLITDKVELLSQELAESTYTKYMIAKKINDLLVDVVLNDKSLIDEFYNLKKNNINNLDK